MTRTPDDPTIRHALHALLRRVHVGDPYTYIRDELAIDAGRRRADVVVINGLLVGFEIKSDRDSTARLRDQVPAYSGLMDEATLLVGPTHAAARATLVPEWWGVLVSVERGGSIEFETLRAAQPNPAVSALALARVLWRSELVCLLELRGAARGFRGASSTDLWRRVIEVYDLESLRRETRAALKRRVQFEEVASQA